MSDGLSRREWMRILGASGLAVGSGALEAKQLWGQRVGESSGFTANY